jgi:hypothetical protein
MQLEHLRPGAQATPLLTQLLQQMSGLLLLLPLLVVVLLLPVSPALLQLRQTA